MQTNLPTQKRLIIAMKVLVSALLISLITFLIYNRDGLGGFNYALVLIAVFFTIAITVILFFSLKFPEVESIRDKLTERENQLSLIYNATTDGILLISYENDMLRIISANDTFLSSYALGEGQVIGKTIEEVTPRESLDFYRTHLTRAAAECKVTEWEGGFEIRGKPVAAIFSATPVIGPQGECKTIVLTIHDITARVHAEIELKRAEAKYRNLVEQSLVGVYIIKEGKFMYVNPHLAKIFGYTQEELINEDPDIIIHPDERPKVEANIAARVLGRKDEIHYEACGIRKDGSVVNLEIFCSGILENEDHAIIGTLLDVSEQKAAEEGRKQALYNLSERIKELTVLNNVSSILRVEDGNVNQVLSAIVEELPKGWRYPELASSKISIDGDNYYSSGYKEPLQKQSVSFNLPNGGNGLIETGYAEIVGSEKNLFFPEEKNLLYLVAEMIRTYIIRHHDENVRRRMQQEITDHKIQEQKKITRAILHAQETERNKIGQELHDNVNQILASAKLYLSAATKQLSDENKELVDNSLRLIMRAIEELRQLSRTQVSPLRRLELDELITGLVDQLNDSTSIDTKLEYDLSSEIIIEDDLKLNIYRIIQEQINNVLKHSEATALRIKVWHEDDLLNITISDNGKGFEPLEKREGIGIANMINRVESFDGRLVIHSKRGEGFTLEITLPLSVSIAEN